MGLLFGAVETCQGLASSVFGCNIASSTWCLSERRRTEPAPDDDAGMWTHESDCRGDTHISCNSVSLISLSACRVNISVPRLFGREIFSNGPMFESFGLSESHLVECAGFNKSLGLLLAQEVDPNKP